MNIMTFLFGKLYFVKQTTHRSSCSHMFFRVSVLKNFTNFTGKYLCWRPRTIPVGLLVAFLYSSVFYPVILNLKVTDAATSGVLSTNCSKTYQAFPNIEFPQESTHAFNKVIKKRDLLKTLLKIGSNTGGFL